MDMEISRKQKGNNEKTRNLADACQPSSDRDIRISSPKILFPSLNYLRLLYVQCTCTRGVAIHRQLMSDWLEPKKNRPGSIQVHSDRDPDGE